MEQKGKGILFVDRDVWFIYTKFFNETWSEPIQVHYLDVIAGIDKKLNYTITNYTIEYSFFILKGIKFENKYAKLEKN